MKPGPALTIGVMPFAPDKRMVVEQAQKLLTATGSFKGFLPVGEYAVQLPGADKAQSFTLESSQKQSIIW